MFQPRFVLFMDVAIRLLRPQVAQINIGRAKLADVVSRLDNRPSAQENAFT